MPSIATEEKRPTELDINMSNSDHSIDDGLDAALRKEKDYAQHAAWDFCGYVWFEGGLFHEEVWQYHVHVDTLSADTLEELMNVVNDKYGDA